MEYLLKIMTMYHSLQSHLILAYSRIKSIVYFMEI